MSSPRRIGASLGGTPRTVGSRYRAPLPMSISLSLALRTSPYFPLSQSLSSTPVDLSPVVAPAPCHVGSLCAQLRSLLNANSRRTHHSLLTAPLCLLPPRSASASPLCPPLSSSAPLYPPLPPSALLCLPCLPLSGRNRNFKRNCNCTRNPNHWKEQHPPKSRPWGPGGRNVSPATAMTANMIGQLYKMGSSTL